MSTNKVILWIVIGCVGFAGAIYATAYLKHRSGIYAQMLPLPSSTKQEPATIEDGTYTVRIHSILTVSDASTITFYHVTYFDGPTASSSAAHDVPCTDKPLPACVPTLTKGYYVRDSGADTFTAPITRESHIVLNDASNATITELKDLNRQFEPVFDVVIGHGVIAAITEKSPI